MSVKISDIIMSAFELVVSRDGDVDTGDGSFATCGIGEIIRLDESIAHYFEVGSDDVSIIDVDLILRKAKEIDSNQELISKQAEQIKMLREALECISTAIAKYSYTNDAGFNVVEILDIEPQCQLVDSTLESTKD